MYNKHHNGTKVFIKKGDQVEVLSGNYRKKRGIVLKVYPKSYRAIVEGIQYVSKHVKPTVSRPQGSRIRVEAPIHISKLQLVNPATGKTTRVGRKINSTTHKLQRYSKKTGDRKSVV